jgi:hypothetical protein
MDKSCANHPESMALATCKACEKSVCLMCVVDEKEGTFCSSDCHTAFANGQEVPKFVGAAAEAVPSGGGAQKIESIFDDAPSAPPSSSLEEVHEAPPSDEPMPIVAEGTKWRPIGAQCDNHTDTPAVANCDRCNKPVCALCLLESSQGTFCGADCMNAVAQQPAAAAQKQRLAQLASAEKAAPQAKPVFKFKQPAKANKTGVLVAVAVVLVVAAIGGYYAYNIITPGTTDPGPDRPPEVVVTPTTTTTIPTTTTTTTPVTTTPTTTPTTNPTTVTTPVTQPTTTPVFIPRPRKPVGRAIPSKTVNPWVDQDAGVWFRLRTTRGSQVTYKDIGLKEKGKDFNVIVTQTSANGQAAAATEAKIPVPTVYLRGEESFTFEGQSFLCEIQTPTFEEGNVKTWCLLSGKNPGAVLKSESPEGNFTASRVWEHTLRVKGNSLECLVIEGQIQSGGSSRAVKNWFCGALPLGLIQQQKDGELTEIVDLGEDWSKRPAFPK